MSFLSEQCACALATRFAAGTAGPRNLHGINKNHPFCLSGLYDSTEQDDTAIRVRLRAEVPPQPAHPALNPER